MNLYDKILNISKNIAIEQGLNCINMRLIAKKCDIALGSIYNYFPSKSDLLIATIESIWKDIFNLENCSFKFENFSDTILYIFETINKNLKKYPDFFTLHSISLDISNKDKGKKSMDVFLKNIKNFLLKILENDKNVRSNAFNEDLTPEIFVDYIFNLLIYLIFNKNTNCNALVKLMENTIY